MNQLECQGKREEYEIPDNIAQLSNSEYNAIHGGCSFEYGLEISHNGIFEESEKYFLPYKKMMVLHHLSYALFKINKWPSSYALVDSRNHWLSRLESELKSYVPIADVGDFSIKRCSLFLYYSNKIVSSVRSDLTRYTSLLHGNGSNPQDSKIVEFSKETPRDVFGENKTLGVASNYGNMTNRSLAERLPNVKKAIDQEQSDLK